MKRLLLWALLLSPALVPFVTPHPPFQDWPAHLMTIGAHVHFDSAHLDRFLGRNGWLHPNCAIYLLGALLATILPAKLAGQLLLSLTLGGVAPAAAMLCKACGRRPSLAILALPVAFARPTYSGFIPNVAGVVLLLLLLAGYLRRRPLLVVVTALLMPITHAFVTLAGIGLLGILVAFDAKEDRRNTLVGLRAMAAAFLLLGFLFGGSSLQPGAIASAVAGADRAHLASDFWSWLFGFRGGTIIDDLLQLVWLGAIAAGVALRLMHRDLAPKDGRLLALLLATLVAFVVVPMEIGPPIQWWGARGRLPAVAALLAIPLVRSDRAKIAGAVAAALMVVYSLVELRRWETSVMPGFDRVVEAAPAGRVVDALYYDVDPDGRFPGAELGYAAGYYVLDKGGMSTRSFFEPKGNDAIAATALPYSLVRTFPSPPWGMAELFTGEIEGVDGFLVRTRQGQVPFYGENRERVTLIREAGAWRYYRVEVP